MSSLAASLAGIQSSATQSSATQSSTTATAVDAERIQVRAVVGGDRDAFAALCRRHAPVLHRFALRMLREPADAEDVVQETLLRFWREARRYDAERARLSTWLHRLTYNACIDLLRRQGRRPPEDADHSAPSPEELTEAEQRGRAVERAIGALPERQRTALLLCHYQRLPQRDAAQVMDVSLDGLESLLARARRRLRTLLADDGLLAHPTSKGVAS